VNVLLLMIPISLLLAASFLAAFVWSVRRGQIDDLETPAYRMLESEDGVQHDRAK
jgi:cbb3-type cytochrome oxidase maturation protein